ncbi:hypothetical protein GOHSU_41_00250 [Gordonia hirsuta DSM 44140 = NBRC 16056]|uniref:Secreted protein n=1 Tax=Gordonia hirsuta DSM 44140 = NBRC 16056 TaxID=1121927 RepID=L7LEN2_9ACTN|nr:hypothetical protein GOHSU_41_00250 [Gordonia hirsuta DSM 44140 = NBRC 16056]
MTTVYFVIAVLALIGAGVLLWLDRNRSEQVHHQRAVWGEEHSFKFRESDSKLRTVFRRAAMDVPEGVPVRDVAYGLYEGVEAVVFDLEETATVVAVRRPTASSVTVDLRYEDVLAPAETDVELLGAMGSRVMFASNLDAARRTCDRRMVALATEAPPYIEILWNEGNWALGSMPLTADPERLDVALDTVRRFADLLLVLPPAVDPQDAPDPRDPHGPISDELADEKTESLRDKARRRRAEQDAASAEPGAPGPRPENGRPAADQPAPGRPVYERPAGYRPTGPGQTVPGQPAYEPPPRYVPRTSPLDASPRPAQPPAGPEGPRSGYQPRPTEAAADEIVVEEVDYDELPEARFGEERFTRPPRPTPMRQRPAAEQPELPDLPSMQVRDDRDLD